MIKSIALASAALAASSSVSAAIPEKPVSIVLVHGGFCRSAAHVFACGRVCQSMLDCTVMAVALANW